jgi:hypothetical protein
MTVMDDSFDRSNPISLVGPADHLDLERLVVEIAWRIDHGAASSVWELFVPDGILHTGQDPVVGHEALQAWGRQRDDQPVLTRHICSGMRFVSTGADTATGSTLLTVFRRGDDQSGPPVPAVVGEDADDFRRTPHGWRFVSRTFETLFTH